ncbi:hypothetical protein LY76DRAFT_596828 [Colletotrichum caudatum]|nr:hypothetical protein LY76DRAFT_596828 [Colletotrichum caudatum]
MRYRAVSTRPCCAVLCCDVLCRAVRFLALRFGIVSPQLSASCGSRSPIITRANLLGETAQKGRARRTDQKSQVESSRVESSQRPAGSPASVSVHVLVGQPASQPAGTTDTISLSLVCLSTSPCPSLPAR